MFRLWRFNNCNQILVCVFVTRPTTINQSVCSDVNSWELLLKRHFCSALFDQSRGWERLARAESFQLTGFPA